MNSYGGEYEGVKVSVSANITVRKNEQDAIKNNEHLFRISEKVDPETGKQLGNKGDIGGTEIFISPKTANDALNSKDGYTFSHEAGHTAAGLHPEDDYSKLKRPDSKELGDWQKESKQELPLNKNNEKSYDGKEWKGDNLLSSQNNGSKPNLTQLKAMYKAFIKGYINKQTIDGKPTKNFNKK